MKEQENNFGIWPPYRAFYYESMFTICQAARESYMAIVEGQKDPAKNNYDKIDLLDDLQNIIQQAGALSRYFWPSYNHEKVRNEIHKKRGEFLCSEFMLSESSVLKDRKIRNFIEHFDENLDLYLLKPIAGEYFPNYVGQKPDDCNPIYYFFRAYFTDIQKFEVLGNEYDINPIIEEIIKINNHLMELLGLS